MSLLTGINTTANTFNTNNTVGLYAILFITIIFKLQSSFYLYSFIYLVSPV